MDERGSGPATRRTAGKRPSAVRRLQANQMPRPNGHGSLNPETLWKDRSPITHQDPSEFARTVELCRPEAFRRYELSAQEELTVRERDAIGRFAARAA